MRDKIFQEIHDHYAALQHAIFADGSHTYVLFSQRIHAMQFNGIWFYPIQKMMI